MTTASQLDAKAVHAGAVPFLKLGGLVCGGWQMARAAQVARRKVSAGEGDAEPHLLPRCRSSGCMQSSGQGRLTCAHRRRRDSAPYVR
jgi:hypothetical protein